MAVKRRFPVSRVADDCRVFAGEDGAGCILAIRHRYEKEKGRPDVLDALVRLRGPLVVRVENRVQARSQVGGRDHGSAGNDGQARRGLVLREFRRRHLLHALLDIGRATHQDCMLCPAASHGRGAPLRDGLEGAHGTHHRPGVRPVVHVTTEHVPPPDHLGHHGLGGVADFQDAHGNSDSLQVIG